MSYLIVFADDLVIMDKSKELLIYGRNNNKIWYENEWRRNEGNDNIKRETIKVNEFMYLEVVKKMKNKYIETKAYSSQYIELY